MRTNSLWGWVCVGVWALGSTSASASVHDFSSDFLPTYAGGYSADVDVTFAQVVYDASTNVFELTAQMSGSVPGATAAPVYVWGANRGAGSAAFADQGYAGILFDQVIILRLDGSGVVNGVGDLMHGWVVVSGHTVKAYINAAMLPSTGFAPENYTWNVWPRDSAIAGFAGISDFAPDNTNLATELGPVVVPSVPEPATLALFGVGAWGVVAARRRSKHQGTV